MAKKFVRGITGIKTINKQDLDTNNVNDLLSDGQHNYIHRKKGNTEEYHNLTNNIKTIESSNTSLLTVTNYNNSTNSARLTPKHDRRKEQVLESTYNTILINHGENGTDETTSVDVNPAKVLEHDNLETSYGISKTTSENTTTLEIEYTRIWETLDLNNLVNGRIRGADLLNAPSTEFYYVSSFTESNYCIQEAIKLTDNLNTTYRRTRQNGVWGEWREQVGDKSVIDASLATKQNTLTSNTSIGVDGTGLMQLYSYEMSYSSTSQGSFEGSLNTYAKTVKKDTSLSSNTKLEYHFTAKLDAGHTSITIPLNDNDKTYFSYILIKYGETSGSTQTAMINGLLFTLNTSQLTVSRDSSTSTYNQVVSFSDIIDPSQDTTQ